MFVKFLTMTLLPPCFTLKVPRGSGPGGSALSETFNEELFCSTRFGSSEPPGPQVWRVQTNQFRVLLRTVPEPDRGSHNFWFSTLLAQWTCTRCLVARIQLQFQLSSWKSSVRQFLLRRLQLILPSGPNQFFPVPPDRFRPWSQSSGSVPSQQWVTSRFSSRSRMARSVPVLLSIICVHLTAGVPDEAEVQGTRTEPEPAGASQRALRGKFRFWTLKFSNITMC